MENRHKIVPINIHDEVKTSFLDYAMSVIVSRALPDLGRFETGSPPHPLWYV